eukprot:1108784-Pelagomonas_calceolata.AAC.1
MIVAAGSKRGARVAASGGFLLHWNVHFMSNTAMATRSKRSARVATSKEEFHWALVLLEMLAANWLIVPASMPSDLTWLPA